MDIKLHYTIYGDGEPIILLHGNGENSEYFMRQIEHFSQNYKVIAVDTRGHGKSPRGTAPFLLSQFSLDLKALLDELGISQANILGFSDGGNIALLFALSYPSYVKRLILNGANLSPSGVKLHIQVPIIIGFLISSLVSVFSKKAIAKKEMLALMVTQPKISPDDLAKIEIPTLIIVGTRDMIKEKHTRLIAKSIKPSSLSIINGSHFIANENPSEFNRCVDGFINA